MSVLTTRRFTVEEYHRMADTGLLKPERPLLEFFHGMLAKTSILRAVTI